MKKMIAFFLLAKAFAFADTGYNEILELYNNHRLPKSLSVKLEYSKDLPQYLKYVLVRGVEGNLRDIPSTTNSKLIKAYPFGTKLKAFKKVKNKYGNVWYEVEGPDGKKGFISENMVYFREFKFDTMLNKIKEIETFVNAQKAEGKKVYATSSYRPNPNNTNLSWEKDKYGMTIDQSIVGEIGNEKIFIPDRSLLSIVKEDKNSAYVKVASIPDSPLRIDKKYIDRRSSLTDNFKKVIAIDLTNQNFALFEKSGDTWNLISYVYSKTGMDSQVGFETPKGFFSVAMAKYEMPYRDLDGLSQGYAMFATRFSGGGYLHGTPINYEEEINREFFKTMKEADMGTFSGTRKCIRTSEEHAKFVFDWVLEGAKKTRENNQYPKEDTLVITF